jgi:mono/diheme cytochrome c family protein
MSSGMRFSLSLVILLALLAEMPGAIAGDGTPQGFTPQQRGYWLLVNKAYVTPDFDQETFDSVWKLWPEPLKTEAEKASPDERRKLAFARYGLTPRPDDPTKPLQYVVDERGTWTMNCFACHGGKVAGKHWPGLPNSLYALQTLTEETRAVKVALGKPLGRMDFGSVFVPLGATNGTTNAVNFGVALMGFRDADLNFHADRVPPKMTHHDMDAPPWWHFRKKQMLYIDGFAEKGHRALSQFAMVRSNGPEKFREWETEYRDIFAYITSIEPPQYPYPIDGELAERGSAVFEKICADCHGTYGPGGAYPEKLVPIGEVKTDRVRLDALSPAHRDSYGKSWFAHYGEKRYVRDPGGYVAPPLDGIWASAPYFHNGSVPTLWHVLHPSQRPAVWKRTEDGYDQVRVGLEIALLDDLPADAKAGWQRRAYYDARGFGKSAAGHEFPDLLGEDEKRAVLEYLKSL